MNNRKVLDLETDQDIIDMEKKLPGESIDDFLDFGKFVDRFGYAQFISAEHSNLDLGDIMTYEIIQWQQDIIENLIKRINSVELVLKDLKG